MSRVLRIPCRTLIGPAFSCSKFRLRLRVNGSAKILRSHKEIIGLARCHGYRCHPERSEAESKDPVISPSRLLLRDASASFGMIAKAAASVRRKF
jgi:hypothetical protein